MELGRGEEQERSRLEELAEEVMTKEQMARKKELEDLEKAGYKFEGTRLEFVADEKLAASGFNVSEYRHTTPLLGLSSERMLSGCSLLLRTRCLTASQDYVTQLCCHPPQLLRSLPGQIRSPKRARARRYSDSSSSLSSSSPSSSGSFTPVNRSPERRSLHAIMDTASPSVVPDELQKILPALQRVVPVLAPGRHKGQAGKIAIIGGCREYTGAPYFAAISALKMGADLAHVFCTEGAATVIKSYSPELIVHPVLHESYDLGEIGEQERGELKEKVLAEVGKWLERFDCIVIGPGLGRDPILLECVAGIIEEAKSKKIPLVLDGDGLFLVTNQPELIVGYPLAVLTPNVMEHKRLVAKLNSKEISDEDLPGQLQELAKKFQGAKIVYEENEEDPENPEGKPDEEDPENAKEKSDEEDPENANEKSDEEDPENPNEKYDEEDLPGQLQKLANKFQSVKIAGEDNQEAPGSLKEIPEEELPGRLQELAIKMEGVTIVQKGKTDYISDGKSVLSSDYYGSPRRCGGQGDVLSGSTAVFVSWAKAFFSNESADGKKDVQERISDNPTMVGALAGSLLCRKSAANAFAQHKRSTVTTNIIECLGQSMEELFPM